MTPAFSLVAALRLAFAIALLALLAPAAVAQTEGPLSKLTFVTKSGHHEFQVEVAKTEAERSQGLMYRRALAADRGMIFDFGSDTDVTMWMKNTFIPLDMVFVRSDGTVHRVQRDTTPFSEDLIPSGAPVRYVIELPAGTARRLGIERGDKVEHAVITAP